MLSISFLILVHVFISNHSHHYIAPMVIEVDPANGNSQIQQVDMAPQAGIAYTDRNYEQAKVYFLFDMYLAELMSAYNLLVYTPVLFRERDQRVFRFGQIDKTTSHFNEVDSSLSIMFKTKIIGGIKGGEFIRICLQVFMNAKYLRSYCLVVAHPRTYTNVRVTIGASVFNNTRIEISSWNGPSNFAMSWIRQDFQTTRNPAYYQFASRFPSAVVRLQEVDRQIHLSAMHHATLKVSSQLNRGIKSLQMKLFILSPLFQPIVGSPHERDVLVTSRPVHSSMRGCNIEVRSWSPVSNPILIYRAIESNRGALDLSAATSTADFIELAWVLLREIQGKGSSVIYERWWMDSSSPSANSNPSLFLIPDNLAVQLFSVRLAKMAGVELEDAEVADSSSFDVEIADA